jgi:hypothetical protein
MGTRAFVFDAARPGFFDSQMPIKAAASDTRSDGAQGQEAPVSSASADEWPGASIAAGSSAGEAARLVGNRQSQVYHQGGCIHIRQLAENHRVLLKSPVEAAARGYRPCQTCRPPAAAGGAAPSHSADESGQSR